jgi:hypothetical protein
MARDEMANKRAGRRCTYLTRFLGNMMSSMNADSFVSTAC